MASNAKFAEIAALAGDPARAGMLHALMDGRALTASELARVAGITPQTASSHISRMAEAGLIGVQKQGRHRYHRLTSPAVARMMEGIMRVAADLEPARPLSVGPRDAALRAARTCYDHLAGELGVAMRARLQGMNYLREHGRDYRLTPDGEKFLSTLGVDLKHAQAKRRRFAYACLDWSHRVPHLGGSLGAALLDWMFRGRLIVRRNATRALRLTDAGQSRLQQAFAIRLSRTGTVITRP